MAGSGLEEEATGVGVGRVVALGFEAALGAGLESLEGSGLRVTGGEPGAGEGEGRADPVEGSQLREERSWREGEPDGLWALSFALGAREAGVPTSAFHLRTISFARSEISLLAFWRSLLTVTPILVSCTTRRVSRVEREKDKGKVP